MKILLYTDVHMCPKASIINKWGTKYPVRLENCIQSLNWLERLAEDQKCDYVISLGDFFDKPDLGSETITACNDIEWSNIMHYSLVGNHEASTSSLLFNSVNSLLHDRHNIITDPQILPLDDCFLCFLPYIVECDRQPLKDYFTEVHGADKPVIILSHNDISGIQLGPVVSKTGFSIEEIEECCDLFLNGHLHNGQQITNKIYNLGNLTGKDFGEDAFKHSHCAFILDTSTMCLSTFENPHAFNFYKIQVDTKADVAKLYDLKQNAVVSVKCDAQLLEDVKQSINDLAETIIDSRIIITKTNIDEPDVAAVDLSVDHLARFIDCCKTNIEYSNMLEEELAEICK